MKLRASPGASSPVGGNGSNSAWFTVLTVLFLSAQVVGLLYAVGLLSGKEHISDAADLQATGQAYQRSWRATSRSRGPGASSVQGSVSYDDRTSGVGRSDPSPVSSLGGGVDAAYLLGKLRRVSSQTKSLVLELKALGEHVAPPPFVGQSQVPGIVDGVLTQSCGKDGVFAAATVNLWNTNAPWPQRKMLIAYAILQLKLDVVAVQEVRHDQGSNQLDQLQSVLPGYTREFHMRTLSSGEEEGVGILSRLPIVSVQRFELGGSRPMLAVKVDAPGVGHVHVVSVHLSINDMEQCAAVVQLAQLLNDASKFDPSVPQIVLGDFNAYFDFEWPMDFLTGSGGAFATHALNPCAKHFSSYAWDAAQPRFSDAWERTHSDEEFGHTFPTFRDHRRLDSTRADRILYRTGANSKFALSACDSGLIGSNLPFKHEGRVMYLSDHEMVIARLTSSASSSLAASAPTPGVPPPLPSPSSQQQQQQPQPATPAPQQPQPAAAPTPAPPAPTPLPGQADADQLLAALTPAQRQKYDLLLPAQKAQLLETLKRRRAQAGAAASPNLPDAPPSSVQLAPEVPKRVNPKRRATMEARAPCEIRTSLTDYEHAEDQQYHGREAVFDGDQNTFFWSDRSPQPGDFIEIVLLSPVPARIVEAYTGSSGGLGGAVSDYLVSGVLEVSFMHTDPSTGTLTRSPYMVVDQFSSGKAQGDVAKVAPSSDAKVVAVRMRCTKPQDSWLIVSEIVLR